MSSVYRQLVAWRDCLFSCGKRHGFVLIPAVLFGLLIAFPSLYTFTASPRFAEPVYPIFDEDEQYYLAMARDVVDGHPFSGQSFLDVHKQEPYLQPNVVEFFSGTLAKHIGISAPTLYAVYDFVFPFLYVLILYAFLYRLLASPLSAGIGAILLALCSLFFVALGRPVSAQISFPLYILGLIPIWEMYRSEGKAKWPHIAIACVIGVSLYIYPYTWTVLAIAYGLTLVYFLFKKIELSWSSIGVGVLAGVVLGLPYALHTVQIAGHPFYTESMARYGLLATHVPGAFRNVAFLVVACGVLMVGRRYLTQAQMQFSAILLIALGVANWQNLITGISVQFSSHYYPYVAVSILIIVILLAHAFFEDRLRTRATSPYTIVAIASVLVLTGLLFGERWDRVRQGIIQIPSQAALAEVRAMSPVFAWLNAHTTPDAVVLTLDQQYENLLPVYTHTNIYFGYYVASHLISNAELEDRWVRQQLVQGPITETMVEASHRTIWTNTYEDRYQKQQVLKRLGGYLGLEVTLPKEHIDSKAVERVVAMAVQLRKDTLSNALKKYRLDYILLTREQAQIEEKIASFTSQVYADANVQIYKVNKER